MSGAAHIHEHRDADELVRAAALAVRDAVLAERQRGVDSLLLLSGGTTPVPVYRALAPLLHSAARGGAGITVSLVDERWVDPDDAGSNARLLRECLGLEGDAPALRLWPLADRAAGLAASVAAANRRLRDASGGITMVILGMGEDGHTASLFPGSEDLPAALDATAPYAALDARGCPGAGAWSQRITLTPSGWKPARRRLLLIRGARKRERLEEAMHGTDALHLPVRAALAVGDVPLEVLWAP